MHRSSPLALLVLLPLACRDGKEEETANPDDLVCEPVLLLEGSESEGQAPWDALVLHLDRCESFQASPTATSCTVSTTDCERDVTDVTPLVVDADGDAPALALRDPPYETEPAWEAVDGLPEGTWALVGVDGERQDGWSETFSVLPYGRDPAFDPALVAGGLWKLDPTSVHGGPVPAVYPDMLPDTEIYLRLDTPSNGKVGFDVLIRDVSRPNRPYQCRLLVGTATLSETGEFSWSTDTLDLSTDPPIPAWDITLRAGFTADGTAAGGVQGRMVVDTEQLSADAGGDLCEAIPAIGGDPCAPCPDDATKVTCDPVAFYGGLLEASTVTFDDDLEDCTAVFPEMSCNLSCASTGGKAAGAAWTLLATAIALLRRRPNRPLPNGPLPRQPPGARFP